ncbi:hypothetical protein ACFX16_028172 [Malus domestica]
MESSLGMETERSAASCCCLVVIIIMMMITITMWLRLAHRRWRRSPPRLLCSKTGVLTRALTDMCPCREFRAGVATQRACSVKVEVVVVVPHAVYYGRVGLNKN